MPECPALTALEKTITSRSMSLTVVDTLLEYGAGEVVDAFSAMRRQPLLKSLQGGLPKDRLGVHPPPQCEEIGRHLS